MGRRGIIEKSGHDFKLLHSWLVAVPHRGSPFCCFIVVGYTSVAIIFSLSLFTPSTPKNSGGFMKSIC